jgi:hypothetical protein
MDLKNYLKLKTDHSKLKSELKKLEKIVGERENFKEKVLEAIRKNLSPLPAIKVGKPIPSKSPSKRELVIQLNDTHYGTFVYPSEVNYLNSYGWKEACRRTAAVINQAITYKPHNKQDISKVHLIINGDVLGGIIHGQNTKHIDQWVHQVNGALHILAHAISALATHFPSAKIEVHGIAGNHDDAIHKREGGRVLTEIYDSYINHVYYSLSWIFSKNKRISFNFPEGLALSIDLPGGRALVTHGHVLFSRELGNPGRQINVKALSDSLHRYNLGEIKQGKEPYKLALFGHVHSHATFTTNDGVQVYISPSLVGLDGYAASLGINNNFAGQLIFESVPDYIVGDSRLVDVTKADNDASLDKIIPLFKRTLKV